MKRRTFLLTLLLFLLTVFSGILLIAVQMYRNTLEQARGQAAAGHYFIAGGLIKDIAALDARGADYKSGASGLMQTYSYLANRQNASVVLHSEDSAGYYESLQSDERRIELVKNNGSAFVKVEGRLSEPYENFILIYTFDITEAVSNWQGLKNIMIFTGLGLSCVLAVGLLLLLGNLFRPLSNFSKTSRRIAGGEYSTRLAVTGKDELAEMADSFNHMADEIERQMAELIATAENKQLFIDNFAHEIRTPLTAIYGYAEYMQKGTVTEDDSRFALECILSESARIKTMAAQMMELANLRRDQIHMAPFPVRELFKKVGRAMRLKQDERDFNLRFSCELNELNGDMDLLECLLTNLIDNAVKSVEPGGLITVNAYEDAAVPVITVTDNGKGIPKEALARLTQAYYKVETHRNRRDYGAGLGLAICERIAERHNAKLRFKSVLGEGTSVSIFFTTS